MAKATKKQNYAVAKVLHWVAGIVIVFNLLSGWRLDSFELEIKQNLLMIHSGVGVVIFLLMVFRWWWRSSRKLYTPPRWYKRPSMLLQWVLYPLVIAQVVIGVAQAAFIDYDVVAFGLIPFSSLAAANEALHDVLLEMHEIMAWVLILLVASHGIERGRFAFIEDSKLMKAGEVEAEG